jgi:hypothetical protein
MCQFDAGNSILLMFNKVENELIETESLKKKSYVTASVV